MPEYALTERHALAETLRAAGPEAPTLCAPWRTRQLAAHLTLRERSLGEAGGRMPIRAAQDASRRYLQRYVEQHDYRDIVATFDAGPPWYSPFALPVVRESVDLLEYVVHHEDVRRAQPEWTPRLLPVAMQTAVWRLLRVAARMTLHSAPVLVELNWSGSGSEPVRAGRARGAAQVGVLGEPVELALLAFGRQRVAEVEYDGRPEDVAALREARISV